jgi:hypothetical protein
MSTSRIALTGTLVAGLACAAVAAPLSRRQDQNHPNRTSIIAEPPRRFPSLRALWDDARVVVVASFQNETPPVVMEKRTVARTETLAIDKVLKGGDRLPRNAATIDIDVFGGQAERDGAEYGTFGYLPTLRDGERGIVFLTTPSDGPGEWTVVHAWGATLSTSPAAHDVIQLGALGSWFPEFHGRETITLEELAALLRTFR